VRVAVLWNGLSGYLSACLRELAAQPNTQLFVSRSRPDPSTPYDESQFEFLRDSYVYDGHPDQRELLGRLAKFKPDVLIVASWNRPEYRAVCLSYKRKALRVCCMDNQWRGTAKQWLGVLTAPVFVRSLFDVTFVAGERQFEFAKRMGFSENHIWRGFLSCDHECFRAAYETSSKVLIDRRAFLYVGRLSPEKCVDTLLDAYRIYRSNSSQPWSLRIAGEGPLRSRVLGSPGVEYEGFVQPNAMPKLFATAGCFVLPSRFEQWGVVLHEAASAGLPIICTPECGASTSLVRTGRNGLLVGKDDAVDLANAMSTIAVLPQNKWREFSDFSAELSLQFTPNRWARLVYERSESEMPILSANQ
jgi:glycosyltransferase involved in cell wall biosynthesis